jgi:hypothetical protein
VTLDGGGTSSNLKRGGAGRGRAMDETEAQEFAR